MCNFRCEFCYLTPEQLSDEKTLDLTKLSSLVNELKAKQVQIDHVDLYGGEIALLSNDYLEAMDKILLEAGDPSLNIVTNMSKFHPFFLKEHVDLSVSFDFECRQSHEKVLQNIMQTNKDIAILMLASPKLMAKDVEQMIVTFNGIQNIKTVEIKPYSSNQANQFTTNDEDFETFVKKWIDSKTTKRFELINQREIESSLAKTRNAFSDDHIYITPSGKFAVLEFDDKNHEFFLELDDFDAYLKWQEIEKKRVKANQFCSKCEYFGRCLTEHYRDVRSIENSCNGFYKLLKWSENHFKSSSQIEPGTK